jgi:hypothetical protein
MRLKQYIVENMDKEKWEKKFDKINSYYERVYKDVIKKIIKNSQGQYYYYNSFEDISSTAMDNVPSTVKDIFTTKFLRDYESSLDAILSQAKEEL